MARAVQVALEDRAALRADLAITRYPEATPIFSPAAPGGAADAAVLVVPAVPEDPGAADAAVADSAVRAADAAAVAADADRYRQTAADSSGTGSIADAVSNGA